MGFNEMGQSIFGIIIFATIFMAAFGGYQNQSIYEEFLPPGVTGPNDVNNYQNTIVVSSQGTPYATVTSQNPAQDNNPIFNFVSEDIPNAFNAFKTLPSATLDLLWNIGLPGKIIFIFVAVIGVVMAIFVIYVAAAWGLGFSGKFGS